MIRSLKRRVEALVSGREPEEVLEALWTLARHDAVPLGAAGARAQALWDEAGGGSDDVRFLRAFVRAGGSLTDVLRDPEFAAVAASEEDR